MKICDIDLNLLIVFQQLIINKSVTQAAEQLNISQPAMSHALKRLRVTFGDELFVRVHQFMEPTPFAMQLAGPICEALNTLQQAVHKNRAFDAQHSEREFVIAMTDIGIALFIPRLMQLLTGIAPDIRLKIVEIDATLAEKMINGSIDLTIGCLPQLQNGFYQRQLFKHDYVCLCRQQHPARKKKMTQDNFTKLKHINVMSPFTGHAEINHYFSHAGITRDIQIEVPQFSSLFALIENSDFVAIVPRRLAEFSQKSHALSFFIPPITLPLIPVNMFWHSRFHKDMGNIWLRNLLAQLFTDYANISDPPRD